MTNKDCEVCHGTNMVTGGERGETYELCPNCRPDPEPLIPDVAPNEFNWPPDDELVRPVDIKYLLRRLDIQAHEQSLIFNSANVKRHGPDARRITKEMTVPGRAAAAITALLEIRAERDALQGECVASMTEIANLRNELDAAVEALRPGYVMVPIVPTNDMLDAGLEEDTWAPIEIWNAMIAASIASKKEPAP